MRKLGLVLTMLVGLFVLLGCQSKTDKPQAVAGTGDRTIGISVDEFKDRFNAVAGRLESKLLIHDLKVEHRAGADVFNVPMMSDNAVVIVGSVDKGTRLVNALTVIAPAPDKNGMPRQVAGYMSCVLTTIELCTPGLDKGQRQTVLDKIGFGGGDGISEKPKSITVNRIKYSQMANPTLGVVFTAEGS